MQATRIPYPQTQRFSKLVLDYLANNAALASFFGEKPGLEGFEKQVDNKRGFSAASREVLVGRLKAQYQSLNLVEDEKAALHGSIEQLGMPNTYTVTTGHQLCLFTGPLYTVYKILHVIRLAEELTEKLDGVQVLPIFWMATEDHDFEEVNHIRYKGHKLVWHNQPGDAVGRMHTQAIKPVIEDLKNRLPLGLHAETIIADLEDAYLRNQNLADATRALVHKWFGKYGIICIDGDDAVLKKAMIPAFTRELLENVAYSAVSATNKKLSAHYGVQVTPRKINLFYLQDGIRSRIVKDDERFKPLSGQAEWSQSELLNELEGNPERFSPNVLLRPLYQETILPNLGYIGGGGEVAYWAQLKDMFVAFEVPFPIVVLRQSVQLVPKRIVRKLQKLELSIHDIFADYNTLSKELVHRNCGFNLDLDATRQQIRNLYNELGQLAGEVDETLIRHIEAQKKRVLNGIDTTEKKLFRAAKKSEDDVLRMLRECMDVLFPGGGLQERHDNIIEHLMEFGPDLIQTILETIQPVDFSFLSLEEV